MPVIVPLLFTFLAITQFKQPDSIWYWKLTLAVGELGHLFIPLILIWVIWTHLRLKRGRWLNYILAILFTAVFLRPTIMGYRLSQQNNLEFSFAKLFGGEHFSDAKTTTHEFAKHLTLDCYHPSAPNPQGRWLLIVHGGGWDSGDSSQISQFSNFVADQLHTTVFSINYRLAPENKWPSASEDLASAIKYIQGHNADFKIQPDNYFLLGRSAGGQIAGEVGYNYSHYEVSRPRGLILLYSPTDMVFAYEVGEENDVLKSHGLIRAFMGGPPEKALADYKAASIIEYLRADSPPTLMIHGQHDYLTWFKHSERLAWRLNLAGVKNKMLLLPWATHGLDFFLFSPGGQITLRALEQFFAEQT